MSILRFKLINDEQNAIARCIDHSCPDQIIRTIEHFASKVAMNIEGFGKKIIEEFYKSKIIHNITDIYDIKQKDQILDLSNMGEKFTNLVNSINNSYHQPLEN